ncbi:MAG: hypothetical protein V2B20_15695 [Pseudomonadota bacterium]
MSVASFTDNGEQLFPKKHRYPAGKAVALVIPQQIVQQQKTNDSKTIIKRPVNAQYLFAKNA